MDTWCPLGGRPHRDADSHGGGGVSAGATPRPSSLAGSPGPWAAGPPTPLATNQHPPSPRWPSQVRRQQGPRPHPWPFVLLAFGRLTHAPPPPPHSPLLPLRHCLSFLVSLGSLERPAGAGRPSNCPQRCPVGREKLWQEAVGGVAVTSCGCLGVMVKGNTPQCQPPSLPESGLWSSASKAV